MKKLFIILTLLFIFVGCGYDGDYKKGQKVIFTRDCISQNGSELVKANTIGYIKNVFDDRHHSMLGQRNYYVEGCFAPFKIKAKLKPNKPDPKLFNKTMHSGTPVTCSG